MISLACSVEKSLLTDEHAGIPHFVVEADDTSHTEGVHRTH